MDATARSLSTLLALVLLVSVPSGCSIALSPEERARLIAEQEAEVRETLLALHYAASEADGEVYFSLFTEDAVFMGTDATERWTRDQFEDYALERFATGTGWTYVPVEQHIMVGHCGTAWFDERLHNEKYGEARGTGVLVKRGDRWLVAHYNLTFPIPNEIAADVVRQIREHLAASGSNDGTGE